MKLRSFPFLFREACLNLRRHGLMTIAAISAITIALSVVGSFALVCYEASGATQHALSEFEMRVFLKPDVSREEGKVVQKRIAALPGVEHVDYLTREEVFATQSKQSEIDVTGVPNLMPDTLNVRLSDAGRATAVADTVKSWDADIESVNMMDKEMRAVMNLSDSARTIGGVLGALFVCGALAVVTNTIRISVFSRRREIKIMQIVGASAEFIRLPLLLEGLIHGIVGGGLAALTLWGVSRYVSEKVMGSAPQFAPYSAPVDFLEVSVYLLCAGAIVGGVGSVLSIRRYLRL